MSITEEKFVGAGEWSLAFPARHLPGHSQGMTLRDYFAGQALLGYLAAGINAGDAKVAEWAYGSADAMLRQRAK